jgi:hypothetical protein
VPGIAQRGPVEAFLLEGAQRRSEVSLGVVSSTKAQERAQHAFVRALVERREPQPAAEVVEHLVGPERSARHERAEQPCV